MKHSRLVNLIACVTIIIALTSSCKKEDSVGTSSNTYSNNNNNNNGNPGAKLTLGSNSPVAVGSTLNLTASSITGASYTWTGPNGFYSYVQNPVISNFTLTDAGAYTCTATIGYAQGVTSTINVSAK